MKFGFLPNSSQSACTFDTKLHHTILIFTPSAIDRQAEELWYSLKGGQMGRVQSTLDSIFHIYWCCKGPKVRNVGISHSL